jgi:hypothetical protein
MSKSMPIFPKFDALEYLNEKPHALGALGSLGAVILPFEKIISGVEKAKQELIYD